MMDTLNVFVECASNYFTQATSAPAMIQTPYLQNSEAELLDYSAVIGVSGSQRGCVYYTAERGLLTRILAQHGEPNPSDDLICDAVGEFANILSGNARKWLGSDFMISVPVILEGKPKRIVLPKEIKAFVVPILWSELKSILIVCLEKSNEGESTL